MGCSILDVPQPVRSAVAELWRVSSRSEEVVLGSGAFRLLVANCGAAYAGVEGSRLPQRPVDEHDRQDLVDALRNFFRWHGAPWHSGPNPDADETVLRLHEAFLTTEVTRTYFAPLDRLDLEDTATKPPEALKRVAFGPNEVLLLDQEDLAQRIRSHALRRFPRWYRFQIERLDGFYWLLVTTREEAGPIWKRTEHAWLYTTTFEAIDWVPVFEPVYPSPVEDALFVLLLCLVKEPSEFSWGPFEVPWTYSVTDDPFSQPQRAPDPRKLSWTLIGPPGQEVEVPDRPELFRTTQQELEDQLGQRWRQLRAALARVRTDRANFHPLTKHFFVKAFAEEGIDEILAHISCIEATLQLPNEKSRKKLMGRYERLVDDQQAFGWLDDAYNLRNRYLHSLGGPDEKFSWEDIARARGSVTKAVISYLALTDARRELNRVELLRSLEN